jgi:hypothetical protein
VVLDRRQCSPSAEVLAIGILGERLASLKFGTLELQLRTAQELVAKADIEVELGNPLLAEAYRSTALDFLRTASVLPIAERYESIRAREPGSRARTATLEEIVIDLRTAARQQQWTAADVSRMFAEGSEKSRIVALASLEEMPELHNFAVIESAIVSPKQILSITMHWQRL